MSRITIVETPRGEAPPEIRRAWVGITMPCVGKFPSCCTVGVLSRKPVDVHQDIFDVCQDEALEILGRTQPQAKAWWNNHGFPKAGRCFTFYHDEIVVLIEDQHHEELLE